MSEPSANNGRPVGEPVGLEIVGAYLFRADDNYRGGPVGRVLGDGADVQDIVAHVLNNESYRTSRFTSFSTTIPATRKFTKAPDSRFTLKVSIPALLALEAAGTIMIWTQERVHRTLTGQGKKAGKLAEAVRAAMRKNDEVVVEGQIPAALVDRVH